MSQTKSVFDDDCSPMEDDHPVGNQSPHSTVADVKCKAEPTKKRYKSLLVCEVCKGDAHCYNFDAISCESCKAFFRRNALKIPGKLKCRGSGHCDVTAHIIKRCRKCRLEKCLRSGMRKEWILSNTEKEEKRHKVQENRRLKQIFENDQEQIATKKQNSTTTEDDDQGDLSLGFLSFLTESPLTDSEWFQIQSIQTAYTSAVQLNPVTGVSVFPLSQPLESTTDLLRIPFFISSIRLISFLKQIDEFQELKTDDQIYLIKLNLIVLSFFRSIFPYNPTTNSYHEQDTTDPFYTGEDWRKSFNEKFHSDIQQLRKDFLDIFPSSDIMMKLSFLILIFSNRVSLNEANQHSTVKAQSLSIFNAQSVFGDLLYKYCLDQFGNSTAPVMFARYVSKVMKLQALIDEIRFTIRDYVDITQLTPLMESLLL